MTEPVVASASKLFFVKMLTRDISLEDAILDLLDNCVDGILRQLRDRQNGRVVNSAKPYEGYWAKITASPESFSLEDNCGGIPRDIAINSAFMLGRPNLERDRDIATVGMYGIGMKRALFKMGRNSRVTSQHQEAVYTVPIPSNWLDDDLDWTLKLDDLEERLDADGTKIIITDLYPSIQQQYDQRSSPFLENLRGIIGSFFALIINKGFDIYLNEDKISPARLDILFPADFLQAEIAPYVYTATIDDVNVELVVGFYREIAAESEIEDEQLIPRKTDNAGWTMICNDRIVLHRDKTELTGWGAGNVPKYHTQFIAIAGVVQLTSNNSLQLPLNTTKRGLDTSSLIYWKIREHMMQGLKIFTNFTNSWKGREAETTAKFAKMVPKDPKEIIRAIPETAWNSVRGSEGREKRYVLELPTPPIEDEKRRITFLRRSEEIELLAEFFFDNSRTAPAEVGNRCFDEALKLAV